MRLAGAVMGTIFFLFLIFGWLMEDVSAVTYLYLILFGAAILWGAHIHIAERCPHCGTRIGSWFGMEAYFGLPSHCKQCGVAFR